MKRVALGCAIAVIVAFTAGIVYAASLDEAKAITEKAAEFWKANGKEKALAEFNNPNGPFVKGDLYVVAHDFKGNVLAHGGNPKLVGTNLYDQKDPNGGKYFVREQIEPREDKGQRLGRVQLGQPRDQEGAAEEILGQKDRTGRLPRQLRGLPVGKPAHGPKRAGKSPSSARNPLSRHGSPPPGDGDG